MEEPLIVKILPTPGARSARDRGGWLVLGLVACAHPVKEERHEVAPAHRRSATAAPSAPCRGEDGAPLGADTSMGRLMSQAVNPMMTQLATLLFHDPRSADDDARNDAVAAAAENLASCLLSTATRLRAAPAARADFEMLARLAAFNSTALAGSIHSRDRSAEIHWFMHIKEMCQSCHGQFRYRKPSSGALRGQP